ncbi:hypothetical protein M4D73_19475 [Streptomyces pseudogriseolus]|nr:hypothetical protein [Streptomyces pseudogriseolus]
MALQRKYGMRSWLFTVLPVGMAEAWSLYLLSWTSGGVRVGEVLLGEGDAGGFAGFAGGGGGWQDADVDEVDADAGNFGVGGPGSGGAVSGEFEELVGDVVDDEVGGVLPIVMGVLDDLVHAFGEVALATALAVEDLAVADEGVAAAEVADEVGFARS